MKEIDFAALLCSRLCHDLISPVSAVSNGIEILEDEKDAAMREQVMDLIKKSALQASSAVQFFRVAFGAGGGFGNEVELGKINDLIENFIDSKKINLVWHSDFESLSINEVKLLLNITLLASESLVRGGVMDISLTKSEKNTSLQVKIEGEHIILYPPAKAMLENSQDSETSEPRTAPISLIFSLSDQLQAEVSVQDSEPNFLLFTGIWPAII